MRSGNDAGLVSVRQGNPQKLAQPGSGTIVRSRAPLRLGFAGGGTDVAPFCDDHGGCVLNATITLYARVDIRVRDDNRIRFVADDVDQTFEAEAAAHFEPTGEAVLHKGVYNRFVSEFNGGQPLPVSVRSSVEAPAGSGLGSSSALVVALVEAYRELLRIPMSEEDVAKLAFDIERRDLGLAGGRQDQFAAAFGGFNFIEFRADDLTIVNPLRIRRDILLEIEASMVLYYLGQARNSADIIKQQQKNMSARDKTATEALFEMKREAGDIKEALLRCDLRAFADTMNRGWAAKKRTAPGVSNAYIDTIIKEAIDCGAFAAKLTGAGGGGFLLLMAEPSRRSGLIRYLQGLGRGMVLPCHFALSGAESWRMTAEA